jgi:SprT protein
MIDAGLYALLEQSVGDFMAHGERLLQARFRPPTFDVSLRGLMAGKAHLQRWHLQFNAVLLRENREHFLRQTVGHEVAHLLIHATTRGRAKPHGTEWRALMRAFGLETRATHDYDVSNLRRSRAPYVYRCHCDGDIRLGPVRHRRIARGVAYFCRRCKTPLIFSHRAG